MKVSWSLLAGLLLVSLSLSVVRADLDHGELVDKEDPSEAEQKQLLESLEEEMDLIKQLDDAGDDSGVPQKRGFFGWIKKAVKRVGKFFKKHKKTIKAVVTGVKIASTLIGKREMAVPVKVPAADCSNVLYGELTDDAKLKAYMEKLSEEDRNKVLACVELSVLRAESEAKEDSDEDDSNYCDSVLYEKLIEDEDVEEYLSGLCEEKQEQVLECLKLAEAGAELRGGENDVRSVEKRGLFGAVCKGSEIKLRKFTKKLRGKFKVMVDLLKHSLTRGKRELEDQQ